MANVLSFVSVMSVDRFQFPLITKSKKLHELITEQEANTAIVQNSSAAEEEIQDEKDEQYCHISLPEFPGGPEAFEAVAKFCYGVKIELSASNVAALRCAGEVLEMTEEFAEDNLISRTERFLSQSLQKSIKDSIKTLKSCESLMPLAETLGIVQCCINSIAAQASSTNPSLLGWPVQETEGRLKNTGRAAGGKLWFDELALLSLTLFRRLISAMKTRDLNPEIIENCLIYYTKRYIPGASRSNRKPSSLSTISNCEQRELLETIIASLPVGKSSGSSNSSRFLFGLLRSANILNASEDCKAALERKIGSQLEKATLDDLLIPSYSYLTETLYDVDCVERILGYFLDALGERTAARIIGEDENSSVSSAALMLVGKLIDGYLSEIATDGNLNPEKFYALAVALPDQARLFHDGLYRAVDVYLKAHPWTSEADREKICAVMDYERLTLEACTHAAQNERLPLRAVIQVLFFEQLQLRQAITGNLLAAEESPGHLPITAEEREGEGSYEDAVAVSDGATRRRNSSGTWSAAERENQVMRLDVDSMRLRVHELERECSSMKKAIAKMDKVGPRGGESSGWNSLTRKFGCKFKTQVCDSHLRTVVEARRGQSHHRH
ncbi:hypothetical protein NMG60_11026132 [Bertholletia excelsa]